jgi:hypothetical protein
MVSTLDLTDDIFTYKVKTIDEFIGRFNADTNSFIKKEYVKKKKAHLLTREKLTRSLLNFKNTQLIAAQSTQAFIETVNNPQNSILLSFTAPGWYAEATCSFLNNGKQVEVPIILHIVTDTQQRSKWMISAIGTANITLPAAERLTAKPASSKYFLPTSSDATNFVEFSNLFTPGFQPAYYFEPDLLKTPAAAGFTALVKSKKLVFKYCSSIKYHFFQVDGWYFSVSQFQRPSLNSGWLIDFIEKSDKESQKTRLKAILHQ